MRCFATFVLISTCYAALAASSCSAPTPAASSTTPVSDAKPDTRLDWWRDARFGMFIHWGLYAIPAGEWNGEKDHAEWIRTSAKIPLERYEELEKRWNPVLFDAERWVQAAQDAGMNYIVITTKHHDGFCLFDSKQTDWDVMSTPFRRDVLTELAAACAKHGVRLCFYHSIMDWHHPDYLPRREWESERSTDGADFERYVRYLHAQVSELLTSYGPIGVMWFDGEWESTWNHRFGLQLYDLCRELQPNVIVNNRVDVGRSGMAGMTEGGDSRGDFGTPEQEVPATGFPGVDWESCMTMNDHWGYNAHDKHFKSTGELVRTLVDVASKGGNYLLNVGPTAEGEFPPESVERLASIGRWMRVNGDAIHGTEASPIGAPEWGRVTMKRDIADTLLYLHVFDWPRNGVLPVSGIGNDALSARVLSNPTRELAVQRTNDAILISLPNRAPEGDVPVIELVIAGAPIAYPAPRIVGVSDTFVRSISVRIEPSSSDAEVRMTTDGSDPKSTSPLTASLDIDASTSVRARAFRQGRAVSLIAERKFVRAEPSPAVTARETEPGLLRDEFTGDWERMPVFTALKPTARKIVRSLTLEGRIAREHVGLLYQGLISIAADDVYAFELSSDDGARLWLDDQLVVDNDGLHARSSKRGESALARGFHALRVEWFNRTGDEELELRFARAGERLVASREADFSHAK